MNDFEEQISDILNSLNWLIEPHDSFVELVKIEGNRILIRCVGSCAECKTDCIGVAFKERMPDIDLIVQ